LKSTYDALVSDLKRQIRERDTQAAGFQGRLSDLKRQIREKDIQAAGLQGRLSDLKKELQRGYAQAAELQEKDGQAVGLQEKITDLVRQSHEKDMRAAGLQEKIADLNRHIQEMDAQTALLQEKLKGHQSLMLSLREKLGEDQTKFKELREYLSEIEEKKVTAEAEVGQLKSTYDALISDLNKQIQKKEITIRGFEEKLSITFVDRILFKSGWANVTPEGNEILKKVGEILKNVQNRDIRVVGHTDNIPLRQEYRDRYPTNWELSSARAAAVVRYFQWKSGIDPGNLEAVGSSFYHPIAGNESEEGRAQNRRVEIVIAPKID
jgi:chemotaxis protein MotB